MKVTSLSADDCCNADDRQPTRNLVTGVILAGGRARRLGGIDKGLLELAGKPLAVRVAEALAPQVSAVVINANRNLDAYAALGYPVIADRIPGYQGPLAGIASAMESVSTPWILTAPCDGPFLAPDLRERLAEVLAAPAEGPRAELAVASDGATLQPVFALLPVVLAASIRAYLGAGERRVAGWCAHHRAAVADFSDRPECFANINTAAEAADLTRLLAG